MPWNVCFMEAKSQVCAHSAGYDGVLFCAYIVYSLWNFQEYLARLRQIRLQNFNERQQIKARLRGEKVYTGTLSVCLSFNIFAAML